MAKKAKGAKPQQNPLAYLSGIQYEDADQKIESSWYRNSKAAIRSFLNTVFGVSQKPTKGLKTPAIREAQEADDRMYEKLAQDYLAQDRKCFEDLIQWRKKAGKSPRTMQMYLSPVKIFLEKNGKPLTSDEVKKLYKEFKKGKEVPTDTYEKHQIRSFLEHCDPRLKAITLLLASSGMRIGEVLSLTDAMFDRKRKMITIPADNTKTDVGRVVFFNQEAAEALQEWKEARAEYILKNNKFVERFESGKPVSVTDERIFPYDPEPINRAWNKTAKKAGMAQKNAKTGFINFHPHGMRKYFSTQMRLAGCPSDIVEILMGHTVNLPMYVNFSTKQYQEMYEKHSEDLTIGHADDIARTVKEIEGKFTEQNGKLTSLESELIALREENARLKNNDEMEKLRKDTERNKRIIDEIYAKLQTGELVIPSKSS